jgi:hypothetical protein
MFYFSIQIIKNLNIIYIFKLSFVGIEKISAISKLTMKFSFSMKD